MEIKTLQAVKDEIAQKYGHVDFNAAIKTVHRYSNVNQAAKVIELITNEAAEAYAYQMCEVQKEKCGEIVEKNFGIVARHVAETEPNVCKP